MAPPLCFFIDRHRADASASQDSGAIASRMEHLANVPAGKLLLLRRWLLIELQDLRNTDLLAPLVRRSLHVALPQCQHDPETRSGWPAGSAGAALAVRRQRGSCNGCS